MYDPIADAESTERKPISPRVSSLEDARIGLFDNGKPAAEPTLSVVGERLQERYPTVELETYAVDHLNQLKNEDELDRVASWAETKTDACIGAIGDCGSCTKFLVYGLDAVEGSGTPAVGLIDEGFVLDWETNSKDFGRQLRNYTLPEHAEVTDVERIRERITQTVVDDIVAQLTTPRTDEERAGEAMRAKQGGGESR